MEKILFKQGEVIFRQGDEEHIMYKILSGSVGIYIFYQEVSEKLLVSLEEGKVFGEMAMLEDLPRSATAVALSDTEVLAVRKDEFSNFIVENPNVATDMLKHTFTRLRALTGDYMDACKTISEIMNEGQKPKKPGLFAKIKKYAQEYNAATAEMYADENYMNAYLMNHFNMMI